MLNLNRTVRTPCLLAVGFLCLANVLPVIAQTAHEHGHAGAAVANLTLNAGQKWETEPSLRAGMAAIRSAFDADHPAIHAGKETDAQYAALADRIRSQVNSIVEKCHLPEAADANLHYIIADLSQGVVLMRGQDKTHTRHDGAALVHGALIAYGKYFDDPGWAAETAMKR